MSLLELGSWAEMESHQEKKKHASAEPIQERAELEVEVWDLIQACHADVG